MTATQHDLTSIAGNHRDVRAQLAQGGYQPVRASQATRDAVSQMMCKRCGHIDHYAESWAKPRPDPIITLATCRVCGHAESV